MVVFAIRGRRIPQAVYNYTCLRSPGEGRHLWHFVAGEDDEEEEGEHIQSSAGGCSRVMKEEESRAAAEGADAVAARMCGRKKNKLEGMKRADEEEGKVIFFPSKGLARSLAAHSQFARGASERGDRGHTTLDRPLHIVQGHT